jgi:pilus assembly protein CpaB
MMMNSSSPPPEQPVVQAAPAVPTDMVLVAGHDLPYGTELTDADSNWVEWPKAALPAGALTKSEAPNAQEDVRTSYVRTPISGGEPIRKDHLVKGVTAGLMSTMLSPGMRAIAIDVSVNNTAGGFVLPNDRVDVIKIYRDPEATKDTGHEVYNSEVVLKNVRVLALGQTVEKKGAEPVVTGSTATLELDPRQAQAIILAQRTGQLTLMLRPITDAISKDAAAETPANDTDDNELTLVRRGVPVTLRAR